MVCLLEHYVRYREQPNALSTQVWGRKFVEMWISTEKTGFWTRSCQGNVMLGNNFAPSYIHAASKYPVDGVEQLPRNSNECL